MAVPSRKHHILSLCVNYFFKAKADTTAFKHENYTYNSRTACCAWNPNYVHAEYSTKLQIYQYGRNLRAHNAFCFKHKPQPASFLYFSHFNPNFVPLRIGVRAGIQIESDNLESVFSIECNCIFIAGLCFKNAHSCAGSFCRIGNCIPQQRSDAFAAHISRSSGSSRH